MRTLPVEAMERFGRDGLPGVGFEALFLVIPVILATWQYGRRACWRRWGLLAAGQPVLTPLVSSDADRCRNLSGRRHWAGWP